jgi:hypothetical protein
MVCLIVLRNQMQQSRCTVVALFLTIHVPALVRPLTQPAGRDANQSEVHDLIKELNIQFDNLCQVAGWGGHGAEGAAIGWPRRRDKQPFYRSLHIEHRLKLPHDIDIAFTSPLPLVLLPLP